MQLSCAITSPGLGQCVTNVVTKCGGIVVGIEIRGTALGSVFGQYSLTYSEDGGPIQDIAVVYPNCDGPYLNSVSSSMVQVSNNILGYLNVLWLSPNATNITVYLAVTAKPGGHPVEPCKKTTTFSWLVKNVNITMVGSYFADVAPDAFQSGMTKQLLNAPGDPDISIGGIFSVQGGANIYGCGRIISQFQLTLYAPPPTLPVPSYTSANSGLVANIRPAVSYMLDPILNPWKAQLGCPPPINLVSTIISNGNLVVQWSTFACGLNTFATLKPSWWNSVPLNGRFVILLEARDRSSFSAPGVDFPGVVSADDQVAVWIDNRSVIAKLESIGTEKRGCGLLKLNDYRHKGCQIQGVAWDPPIDIVKYPIQKRPNDNFGGYKLTLHKNGCDPNVLSPLSTNIPTNYNTRVPPNSWVAALSSTQTGVLAQWDIVKDLDNGAVDPVWPSLKLRRGDRCAYTLVLEVWDTTKSGEMGFGPPKHGDSVTFSIEILNDLP